MTVKELIEKLKVMPQDKNIYIYEDGQYPIDINLVFIDKDGDVGLNYKNNGTFR